MNYYWNKLCHTFYNFSVSDPDYLGEPQELKNDYYEK